MLREYKIRTDKAGFYNITSFVRQTILEAGVKEGIAVVFTPEPDAGVKVAFSNEDIIHDAYISLERALPFYDRFKNAENNSPDYVKALLMGATETLIVSESEPVLGSSQKIFITEFSSNRERTFYVKVVS